MTGTGSGAATVEAELRLRLSDIADLLVPGGQGLPSASQASIGTTLLDEVLRARPDLRVPLLDALRRYDEPGSAEDRLALLRADPAAFDVVATVVAGGYLMSPEVAALLKYPWQEAKPVDPRDVIRTAEDGLLDPVIARGPIYRLPPDAPAQHS